MSDDSASAPASDSPPPPSPDSPPPDSSSTTPPPEESSASPPPPPSTPAASGDDSDSGSSSSNSTSVPSPPPPSSSTGSSSASQALAPPPPPSSTSSSSSSMNSLPVIIGVSVGVGLFVIIVIAICITCCMKKKKRKRQTHDDMHFYSDPDAKHKAHYDSSNYYPSSQHNWQGGNHTNGSMHPPPPHGGGQWPMLPPPPPVVSSEMSSNYSGGPHNNNHPPLPPPSPGGLSLGFNSNFFSYEDLASATGGFAPENLLGQGGFGYVHKGVLPNGKEVAVKSLKSGSGQGEREFQAEVEIISRVHHRHLVSLVGYCMAGPQRMLVYEFVPNNTLEYHLHGRGRPVMDWETRLRIALGSARGLAYLHEDCHPRIIHRDIKAANILLDNNFEAMVADFGLAKLSSDNNTHVSTRVMGTFGYLAPEYASSGKLTEKSDVFSFGVMLLELITGRRPVDNSILTEDSLVDWARPIISRALEEHKFDEVVDARLEGNYNPQEMARMVACGGASIRHSGRKRPKMSQIVRALEGDMSLEALNEVPRTTAPASGGSSAMFTNSQYDTAMYNADMEKFRKVALSSQEFSSEFGGGSSASDGSNHSPKKI